MIEIEVKVIGIFDSGFLTVSETVSVKDDANPLDALDALYKKGAIEKPVYKTIKSLRPPFFLVHNDQKVEGKPKKIRLADKDQVSVMQLMLGG